MENNSKATRGKRNHLTGLKAPNTLQKRYGAFQQHATVG